VFVVSVWKGEYREDAILNITVIVVGTVFLRGSHGRQYREEMLLNFSVFSVDLWEGNMERN
jgi:hypothetical protein